MKCCVSDCGGAVPPARFFVCRFHFKWLDAVLYRELCEAYRSRRHQGAEIAAKALDRVQAHVRDTIDARIFGTYSPADQKRAKLEPFGRARSREEVG